PRARVEQSREGGLMDSGSVGACAPRLLPWPPRADHRPHATAHSPDARTSPRFGDLLDGFGGRESRSTRASDLVATGPHWRSAPRIGCSTLRGCPDLGRAVSTAAPHFTRSIARTGSARGSTAAPHFTRSIARARGARFPRQPRTSRESIARARVRVAPFAAPHFTRSTA